LVSYGNVGYHGIITAETTRYQYFTALHGMAYNTASINKYNNTNKARQSLGIIWHRVWQGGIIIVKVTATHHLPNNKAIHHNK